MSIFQIIGTVNLPAPVAKRFGDVQSGGFGKLLQLTINILIIVAGIYALFNFLLAGYAFLAADGDSKKVEQAWAKIWQSVIGLVFVAGAFVLAAIFGALIFGDSDAFLSPTIPTL